MNTSIHFNQPVCMPITMVCNLYTRATVNKQNDVLIAKTNSGHSVAIKFQQEVKAKVIATKAKQERYQTN